MNTLTKIIGIIFFLLLSFALYSQTDIQRKIRDQEAKNAELRRQIEEAKKNLKANSMLIEEVRPMSNEEFAMFCNEYHQKIEQLRNDANNSNINSRLVYSCTRDGNTAKFQIYFEQTINPPRSAVEMEIENDNLRLTQIQNQIALYRELQKALQHQINYNMVEVADNAGDLLLKHVSLPEGTDKIKEIVMEETRIYYGVDNEKPIKNELADDVNKTVEVVEKIAKYVPGGDKLTSNYLWLLFKSTPEAGKGLGHLAASVNIYFRKKEYKTLIKELEEQAKDLEIKINIKKHDSNNNLFFK